MGNLYDFNERKVVITGGAGVLCGHIAKALLQAGAYVAVLDLKAESNSDLMQDMEQYSERLLLVKCNVLQRDSVKEASELVVGKFGDIDVLINGAGGNKPQATTSAETPFFDLPEDALRFVFELNILGTIIPSQIFGKLMARRKDGIILNISSMNSFRPLTRIPAYSAAKAGVSNFTQWLAVHMAQEYSPTIRVNAIAPGFFLTDQNRFLLTDAESGRLTPRGEKIISHTPMARFGKPEDLLGAVFWLISPASSFVSGIVVPIDGGFSAYSGV